MAKATKETNPPAATNAAPEADFPAVARLRRRDVAAARLQRSLALAAGGAVVLFLLVVYLPSSTQLADLDRRINDDSDRLGSAAARAARLPQVTRAADALEASLAEFKPLPDDARLGEFIAHVTEVSGRLQLRDFNLDYREPVRDESLSRLPVRLSFGGDFANVFNFLRMVESLPRPLRVRELSVRRAAARGGAAAAPGEVDVAVTVNLYYRSTPGGD